MSPEPARLVGRDRELGLLLDALREARVGRPATIVLGGEAGIGKTRLLAEVTDLARADGFLVATGHCSPVSGARLPYGPVVDLLADVTRQTPDLRGSVPEEVWRGLAPLTGATHPQPSVPDLGLASTRMFAAFVATINVVSGAAPALLVLEDLHWADSASVDLIAFAARTLRDVGVATVLSYRPADAPPRSPVRRALAELNRVPNTTSITLAPLTNLAVDELLGLLPNPPDTGARHRITHLAEGVPFYALHLASHDDGSAVPARLRDVLGGTLDDLSADERAFLVLLATMGDLDEGRLLLRAFGGPVGEFTPRVRRLVDRGLLAVRGGVIGFRHALLREVVVADTLPHERAAAHTRAADALLAAAATERASRSPLIAHHLLGCGRDTEALGYAVRGARQAMAVWAFADARRLFASVRERWSLVDEPAEAAGATRATLLREEAIACRWCGSFEEALDLLRQALDAADLPPALVAETEHAHGQVLWAAGDMGASLDAYRRAAALLTASSDGRLRAAVLASWAHGLMATGRAREAEATARVAADLAGRAGAEREQVHALITAAVARAQLGDVDAAVSVLRDCLPRARRLDDIELVVRCYGNLTFALGISCRYEELASAAAEGTEVCRRYGPVVSLASTLISNQVNALVALGRWDDAVRAARTALGDVTASSVGVHLRLALAEVAVARGHDAEADACLAEARTLGVGNPYTLSPLAAIRAERALWQHDPEAAAAHVGAALPDLLAQDDALPLLEACWLGLRAAADVAESTIPVRRGVASPGGGALVDVAREASLRSLLPVAAAILLTCQAEADRVTGSDRVEQWASAAEANAALRRPYHRAYCLMRLGAVHLRRQARSAATEVLDEGLRSAEMLGAVPLAAEIRSLFAVGNLPLDRPVDGPAPRKPQKGPHGLTPRERQVLAILTTGATNRVVARTLFISERTASVHVSNILMKLGAANRTEAARIALRLHLDIDDPQ